MNGGEIALHPHRFQYSIAFLNHDIQFSLLRDIATMYHNVSNIFTLEIYEYL